jgi:hypothetical protein
MDIRDRATGEGASYGPDLFITFGPDFLRPFWEDCLRNEPCQGEEAPVSSNRVPSVLA